MLTKTSARGHHRYEKLSQQDDDDDDQPPEKIYTNKKKWWNRSEERLDNCKNEIAEKQMEMQEKRKLLELKKKSR